MTQTEDLRAGFATVDEVVADHVRFKLKLGIGEDAYATVKYGKRLQALWDIGGVAASGAGLAASSTVATTFFSTGGILSSIGFGAAAVTPVGWVAVAAVMSGGAYYGVTRLFGDLHGERVATIPKFINTPIDILGSRLFDLIAPLALKVARIDGDYDPRERKAIVDYFVGEWGLAADYVNAALNVVEAADEEATIQILVEELSNFKAANPDCNYTVMSGELIGFLREIAEADLKIDEREDMAIDRIERALADGNRLTVRKAFSGTKNTIEDVTQIAKSGVADVFSKLGRIRKRQDD